MVKEEHTHPAMKPKEDKVQTLEEQKQELEDSLVQSLHQEKIRIEMDKIRKEVKLEDYRKKVLDPEWTGNIFMLKAVECVGDWQTLPTFFIKMPTPDNETKKENKVIIKPEEPQDLQEESPDQPKEESEGSPQTIFQG